MVPYDQETKEHKKWKTTEMNTTVTVNVSEPFKKQIQWNNCFKGFAIMNLINIIFDFVFVPCSQDKVGKHKYKIEN